MYITSQEGSSPLVSNEPQLHLIFQASEPVKDFEPEDIEFLGGGGVISSFQAISGTQFEAVFTEQKNALYYYADDPDFVCECWKA